MVTNWNLFYLENTLISNISSIEVDTKYNYIIFPPLKQITTIYLIIELQVSILNLISNIDTLFITHSLNNYISIKN